MARGIRPVVCAKLNQDALRCVDRIIDGAFESQKVQIAFRSRLKQKCRPFQVFFELCEQEYLILLGAYSQYAMGKCISWIYGRQACFHDMKRMHMKICQARSAEDGLLS